MTDTTTDGWQRIATLAQLRDGEPWPAKIGETPIALYRIEGKVHALDDVCTHAFALLSQGFVEGCAVECPLHQAMFDIPTGKCLSGPATTDLRRHAVKIENDAIYVRLAP